MVNVPFVENVVYGNILRVGIVKEGEPYIRFTLRDPVNVGLVPGDYTKEPGSRKISRYKEEDFRYIDIPLKGKEDKFTYPNIKPEPIHIKPHNGKYGCLFIPASSILSIDVRDSYPGKRHLRWDSIKCRFRKYIKWFAYSLGFALAVLQIAYILNEWMHL